MRKYIIILLTIILNLNCFTNPDKVFNNAIIQYKNGDKKEITNIEKALLGKVSTKSYSNNLNMNDNYLYKMTDSSLKILYPVDKKLKNISTNGLKTFDYDENYVAISDGEKIEIHDLVENNKRDITPGDEKNQVKSIAVFADMVIYYAKNKLHTFEASTSTEGLLTEESFQPPYKKLYNVFLNKHDNFLSVMLGIAGSYYLSVVNMEKSSVQVKNIALSSSKFHMKDNEIYYIQGTSGNWKIYKYAVIGKSKKHLRTFKDLVDIEFTSKGYIFETSKGLFLSEYHDSKSVKIPFNYKLAGKCNNHVLLTYNKNTYLVDIKSLIDNISYLKEVIPEII